MRKSVVSFIVTWALGAGCAPSGPTGEAMPAIAASFERSRDLAKIGFECSYLKDIRVRRGDSTLHTSKKVIVPTDRIPEATADYTRHLIMGRFFSDPMAWGDGNFGISLANFSERGVGFRMEFRPLRDYHQQTVPRIWHYVVTATAMNGKPCCLARLLVSEQGHILYPDGATKREWAVGYVRPSREGVYLDIIDDFPARVHDCTGRVTEYFFRFGTKSLEKLRVVPKRVKVMPYLNDYFDGRFHLGKGQAQ